MSVLDPRDSAERILRLRIEATVHLFADPTPVLFASAVNPATLRFNVSEASHV